MLINAGRTDIFDYNLITFRGERIEPRCRPTVSSSNDTTAQSASGRELAHDCKIYSKQSAIDRSIGHRKLGMNQTQQTQVRKIASWTWAQPMGLASRWTRTNNPLVVHPLVLISRHMLVIHAQALPSFRRQQSTDLGCKYDTIQIVFTAETVKRYH
jgi:hypothetical protein